MPALPEIFLLAMICLVLLTDLFANQSKLAHSHHGAEQKITTEKNTRLTYFLTQFTLLVTGLLVIYTFKFPATILFNGNFVWDIVAGVLKLAILLVSMFVFLYSCDYIEEKKIPGGEYFVLGLFSILGMMLLVSSYNLLTLYLSLELTSLPLYALVAIQKDSSEATEAAMKYFVMGALASGILLYGISMVYGAIHSVQITEIATTLFAMPMAQKLLVVFGLVFIVSGVAFKLGAAPFHMWVPDVYQGAPTSVTLFIGSAPKIAAFGMAIRIFVNSFQNLVVQWQEILIIVAVLSIAIGNLVAIVQSNLKRMLSYSAIAHIGYMTLGLLAATTNGYAAALFYIIIYALMSTGAFAILVLLSKKGLEVEKISDLRGLNAKNPWLAFMMLLIMFSMAGIPPTAGFFAKLGVLLALIEVHKIWLATLALVFAIIGAYYYLNVVKVMYFEEPEQAVPTIIPLNVKVAITINGLAILLLGMFPGALLDACRSAFF